MVLRSLEKNGTIPEGATGHIEQREYEKFYVMMGQVDKNAIGGPLLEKQLERWGRRAL